MNPPSTGPLTAKRKRLALRGSKRKPLAKGKPYLVGDDFLRILPEAKRLLARALTPNRPGRPRTVT